MGLKYLKLSSGIGKLFINFVLRSLALRSFSGARTATLASLRWLKKGCLASQWMLIYFTPCQEKLKQNAPQT